MRALVTGGGGFLGQYIVQQLLAEGHRVRVLGRGTYPQLAEQGVEIYQADLRDGEVVAKACAGQDVVFHTAAKAGVWGKWREYHGINTLGTYHVIAGCRRAGVPRLVYTSSPSVTFAGTDQCGIDECAPYPDRWLAHYPHSKALAEQAVLAAADTSLATCALRPHLIWGPRDSHLIPRLLDRARRGRLRIVGRGDNLIDMVYVENAASAHLLAAEALAKPNSDASGKAYFISQGQAVNCWDWIGEILVLAGLEKPRKAVSAATAYRVGAMLEGVWRALHLPGEPPMTRFVAAQLSTSHYFDISAARRDLNYTPTITTEQGMQRLAAWIHESDAIT